MICYQDKTFCPYFANCQEGMKCHRALTPRIEHEAKKWSKQYHPTDILICQFVDKPECFKSV